jgi:hypothetical protein
MTLAALVCALSANVYAQEPIAPSAPVAARIESRSAAGGTVAAATVRTDRVQVIVDELRDRLGLRLPVRALPVAENSRVASVSRDGVERSMFVLSIQQDFLDSLTDEELGAVAAHELGHVWIFTHHPFLQTEELANEIALRAVSRASLDQVYEKLWKRTGQKGDLEYFPH